MKKLLTALFTCSVFIAAAQTNSGENLVQYVKPIIGTERMGYGKL